jgi:hypothetical protein
MNILFLGLVFLYGLLTIADTLITVEALSRGKIDELNLVIKWFLVNKQLLLLGLYEVLLFCVVVFVGKRFLVIPILACFWKTCLIYRNLRILGGR